MVFPTTSARPPKARCHSPALRTTTYTGLLGRSSSAEKNLPRAGDAEAERQHDRRRKTGTLLERAQRVTKVLEEGVHNHFTIQPSRSCTTRLPYVAFSSEWVTCTIVVPAALSSRNSSMMSFP